METLEVTKSDYELERGKPMPTWNHAILQKRILVRIESRYEGQFSVMPELNISILGERLVPDLAVFAGITGFLTSDKMLVTELPVLAIEILSPSQSVTELATKAEHYLQAGVKSCWIVVPEFNTITISSAEGVYQTFDRHETLLDPATGIELELAPLFS